MAFQSLLLVGMAWMLALLPHLAQADEGGPKGLWKNVDDVSRQPRALTRITEVNGVLLGRIEKVFPGPAEDYNPQRDQCEGANKGAPVIGLTTQSGLQKDGDQYTDGEILDSDNGKVYRSKVHLLEGGGKLSARGHIGVPVLGRSQT
ncbi:DUF2147 domain-containing protein [Acidovorax sp. ACV02]|nr:DUF2147 domain-containing protein [Acidovorax sp. ACV02]